MRHTYDNVRPLYVAGSSAGDHIRKDGEEGELVFTSLTKEAFPVIRYRTRDLTRLKPGTARTMRRMEKVTGRSDEMLIIRGVSVFPSQIEELIPKDPHLSPHYVLELYRRDRLNALEVVVEPRADVGADDDATRNACAANLAHEIKSYVGITATVRVVDIGDIERSIGKANRILDMRPKK